MIEQNSRKGAYRKVELDTVTYVTKGFEIRQEDTRGHAQVGIRKNGLALPAEGRYTYNGPDGNQYAGILAQYHVVRTNRFSTYAQAGYFYEQANHGPYRLPIYSSARPERYREQLTYGMLNLGIGAHYRIGNRWSVNALVEKCVGQHVGTYGTDKDNLTLGIGFRIK